MFNSKGFLSKKQPIEDDIFPMNILIEKRVSNDDLTDIISQILNLERKDIFVVEDIQDLRIKIPNNIKVICETICFSRSFLDLFFCCILSKDRLWIMFWTSSSECKCKL